MIRTSLTLFALAAVTACCGPKKTATAAGSLASEHRFGGEAAADSLFFALDRTPCFGRCPTFSIKVFRSGAATLDGRQHVERIGKFTATVPVEVMEKLLARSDAIGFFSLPASYDGQVTDLPSTIIRVVSGSRDHTVKARHNVPPSFDDYAGEVEALLMALPWVAVPDHQ